jgi:hypothetical protein
MFYETTGLPVNLVYHSPSIIPPSARGAAGNASKGGVGSAAIVAALMYMKRR